MRTLTWLLSSAAIAAGRERPNRPIRRQNDQQQMYSNTTQPQSSVSYGLLESMTIAASPVPAPSSTGPVSTSVPSTITLQQSFPISSISRPKPTAISGIYSVTGSRNALVNNNAFDGDGCGGATLNVANASLDWWYDETIYDPIWTLSFQHDDKGVETGWTILGPHTDQNPLDLSTLGCASELMTVTWSDGETYVGANCSEVPQIVAPATTAVTLTGYIEPTQLTGTLFDVPNYVTLPPPPTATVMGTNYTYGTESNVVYFSEYEIMSSNLTKYANGDEICNTVTKTYSLSVPYAFTYTGINPEYADDPLALITDNLDPALSTALGVNVSIGSFTATPTVIYIVESAFSAKPVARIMHSFMTVATVLDIPTPTLPSGITPSPTSDSTGYGYSLYTSLANTDGRIESSDAYLLVPTSSSVTANVLLQSLAVASSTSTTNAFDVLTQALGGAIMQGIGASTETGLSVAGVPVTTAVVSVLVVDGQTVLPGNTPTIVPGPGTIVNVNGQQVLQTTASVIEVAGQTILPGNDITVSGTAVSLFSGGGALKIGASTVILVTRVITAGGQTVTADANGDFVFAGQTLTPGGMAIVGGTTLSLAAGATAVRINDQMTALGPAPTQVARPALTVDGQIVTAAADDNYIISGKSLRPGSAVTITGINGKEILSLDDAGSVLVDVVSGKATTTTLQDATRPVLVIGGETFAAEASDGSTYVINAETITAGSGSRTVTVHGSTYIISLAALPTLVAIEPLGSTGQPLTTTYETLWTPGGSMTNSVPPTQSTTPATATKLALTGAAASTMGRSHELLSIIATGGALLIAAILY